MYHVRAKRICGFLAVLLTVLSQCARSQLSGDNCDLTLQSGQVPRNGTFQSPNWPNPYGSGLRCIYKFIGRPNERVRIQFSKFNVKGTPPICTHDYVDVYTRATEENDVLDNPLHGRYCGSNIDNLPHLLISMSNVFILGFYTDHKVKERDMGFLGVYTFIDGGRYTIGIPHHEDGVCGQIIRGESVPQGILLSPTYPGMYPDNVFCYYKIIGVEGQRVKFTFQDLDLYYGGQHCPFDYVKIYDGYTNEAEEIGVYCGSHKNIELFSTREALTIDFVTKSGRVAPTKKSYLTYQEVGEDYELQRRGFKASFELSRNFVDLSFIKEGHHVRGTECDQRVLSTGESNGTIISPDFPRNYPLNVTCRYYIDGLVDRQNLEKARLQFTFFDIPFRQERCDNGRISAYLGGQDINKDEPDSIFCGSTLPPPLTTSNPRLLLILDTQGKVPGKGFKANYNFVTDYGIPGTPATDATCHFLYQSVSEKQGYFNSPRNPSNYPHNTQCVYEFYGLVREQVHITFENFQVEDKYRNCSTDWLKIYAVMVDSRGGPRETLINKYCGSVIPGPIVTEDANILKIVFNTDKADFASGFKARYRFVDRKPLSNRCFMNITRGGGGVIQSPNYPLKYLIPTTCEWHIYTFRPRGRILIELPFFALEGNLETRGCARAVLKIYTDHSSTPEYEICGTRTSLQQVVSKGPYLKIRFISAEGAVGAKGFLFTWTELRDEPGPKCSGFRCKRSGYCIAKALKCNNQPNCGENDNSDEAEKCGSAYTDHGVLHIILGVVIALVLLIFLLVCILHRRRKARKKKNKQEIEVRYVTRGGGGLVRDPRDGGPRSDQSLLKERTEKVSIV